jgi:hypothetical protein
VALFAAVFFAIHPLRVESVFWVSGAGDLLCGLGVVASLYLHESSLEKNDRSMFAGSVCVFVLALLSKEIAFGFPVFLIVLAAVEEDRRRQRIRRAVPYLSVALFAGLVRLLLLQDNPPLGLFQIEQVLTLPVLIGRYLANMLIPLDHVIHSRMQPVTSATEPRFLVAVGVAALAVVLAVRVRHAFPSWLWAWVAWTLVFLLPSSILGFSRNPYAERYTYVPAIGMSVVVAVAGRVALLRVVESGWAAKRAAWLLAVGTVAVLATVTVVRGALWKDDATLYSTMLKQDPRDTVALYNLGLNHVRRGETQASREYFGRTLREEPRHSFAMNALGNLELLEGNLESATRHYRGAVEADGYNVEAILNLAATLEQMGDCRQARHWYKVGIERSGTTLPGIRMDATRRLRMLEERLQLGGCR